MSIYTKKRIAFDIFLILQLFAVYVFQIVFASGTAVFGIKPFLLIPAAICTAMYASLPQSLAFSIVLGIACDAVSGGLFGRYALLLILITCVIAYLCENIMSKNLLSAFLYHISVYIVMTVVKIFWRLLILGTAKEILRLFADIWIEGIYSALFLVPFYFYCKWLKGKFGQNE